VKITLRPLGNIAHEVMMELTDRVGGIFHCPVEIESGLSDLARAYNPERKQYLSSELLSALGKAQREERVVGIADVDLYVPRLSFVFGEADKVGNRNHISVQAETRVLRFSAG